MFDYDHRSLGHVVARPDGVGARPDISDLQVIEVLGGCRGSAAVSCLGLRSYEKYKGQQAQRGTIQREDIRL